MRKSPPRKRIYAPRGRTVDKVHHDVSDRDWGEGGRNARTFPRARRAPSKKSMMPSIMKSAPNDVSPTPISRYWVGLMSTFAGEKLFFTDFACLLATFLCEQGKSKSRMAVSWSGCSQLAWHDTLLT
jgi:hypothetical protein